MEEYTKKLTMDEIVVLIEQCQYQNEPDHICEECPIFNECLYYYTGDDSKLSKRE